VRPLLILHLVILAWAFTAVLGKLISLPALDMVVWRTALAALGFLGLAGLLRCPLRLPCGDALKLLGIGALLGLHWVTFFLSGRLATASVSLAALPTLMIWCSLIEPLVNGTRRWSLLELIVGGLTVGAVWLIYAVESRYWLGFSVGLFSALLASVYAVTNKQVVRRFHFATLCVYEMLGACIATVLLLPVTAGKVFPECPGAADFGWLLLFAFGCTVVPYAAFVRVMRQLSVFTINVVYNLEPLYGIALAALIFGASEKMTMGFYTGAGIIVSSVIMVPWLQKKAGSPSGCGGGKQGC
jgi:drug/metabolite transporter (DMT)-like permease